jgi:hypothetical protein
MRLLYVLKEPPDALVQALMEAHREAGHEVRLLRLYEGLNPRELLQELQAAERAFCF